MNAHDGGSEPDGNGGGSRWLLGAALVVLAIFAGFYIYRQMSTPAEKPAVATRAPGKETPAEKNEAPPDAPAENAAPQTIDVAARPALVLKGEGKWDDASKTLTEFFAKLKSAAAKAGIEANGKPLAVFTKTDDNGFHFEAMLPVPKAPDATAKLADGVASGSTPAGKALKFEHRGSYDEIDATYEAITAYLDEKGLDTENVFIEEYLTDLTSAEDASVDVDIYVFLKPDAPRPPP